MAARVGVPYVLRGHAWKSKGRGDLTPPAPPPGHVARYPGDPGIGKLILGVDELDLNPQVVNTAQGEAIAPETLAGKPCGAQRMYYTAWTSLNTTVRTQCLAQLAKGRIPWPSVMVAPGNGTAQTFAQAADGRNYAVWYDFIAWCEEVATGPIWFTLVHEPEDNIGGTGMGTGNFADMQCAFRAVMDDYADNHGTGATRAIRIATYQWRNLAFGPIFTDWCFKRTDSASITKFMTKSNGSAVPRSTFQFMGVDTYIGLNTPTEPTTYWIANWAAAVAYCKTNSYPILIGEWGVQNKYPDAGTKLRDFIERILTGDGDVGALLYYNTSLATPPSAGLWYLKDASNANLATTFVNYLKDPRIVRFYDLDQGYATPGGIIG